MDSLLDLTFDGVIRIDDNGNVVDINPAGEELLQIPKTQAIGRQVDDLLLPYPNLLLHRSNNLVVFRQNNALLALVLDQLDVGVHVVDNQGRTLIYNREMADLESISQEEARGQNILDFLDIEPERSTLLTAIRTGECMENQKQTYLTGKGKQITTINSTYPLYLEKRLIGALEVAKNITYVKELADKISSLQVELHKRHNHLAAAEESVRFKFDDILAASPNMLQMIERARQAARTSSTVFIYGETGTGKELFAQSIHSASARAKQPFIAQNCAALPENLLEGMLFGTTKGAFTGAVERPGLFELANGGTVLLDEINSMSPALQAKLLRFLQEKRVRRIGGAKEIPLDVRIIVTSNMEPAEAVKQNLLRKDLYFRLNVVNLPIPPLRERQGDLPLLTSHFLDKFSAEFGLRKTPSLASETLELMCCYDWPGNVRELEHLIEGILNLLTEQDKLLPSHLPQYISSRTSHRETGLLRSARDSFEVQKIASALERNQGNISKTAGQLGLTRQALQYKIKKFGLRNRGTEV